MKPILLAPLLLCLGLLQPAAVQSQAGPGRRAALQERVFQRFLDTAASTLQLDATGRRRLAEVLREGQERRSELRRELMEVRRSLMHAVEDPDAPEEEIRRSLDVVSELRRREYELWRDEQAALARVLTPRQHARFMGLQMRFVERVRELQGRRGPPPGDGFGMGGGPPLDPF